jgi:hypothetical protein
MILCLIGCAYLINIHVEEAADGLVAKVVEVEEQAAGTSYALPGQPEGDRSYGGRVSSVSALRRHTPP